MYRMNKERMRCLQWSLLAILLSVIISACAGMDIIPLTSETFPPKKSMGDVKILSEEPDRQYKKLAEITIADSKKKGWKLQHMILQKAAEMGADAVVFADPTSYSEKHTTYSPVYRPWGYYSPYYGWYGGGYIDAVPTTYKTKRTTLTGVAIRYVNGRGG